MSKYNIVGLGEILWDLLPEGKKPGGAPANFAYHANVLGNTGVIAGRIGDDENGREMLQFLQELNLTDQYLQIDPDHPTGTVDVKLDENGQPDYTITEDVAWDFLSCTPEWENLAAQADAVCFGSLAQRSPVSRKAVRDFLEATGPDTLRIFDINLRQHYFSTELISESLDAADIVKLNNEELPQVAKMLLLDEGNNVVCSRQLIDRFDLELVCLTRGEKGSMLVTDNNVFEHSGYKVRVVDAVGAGDAFTAVLAHHYLRETPLERICEAANRYGSWVATQSGATPEADKEILYSIL